MHGIPSFKGVVFETPPLLGIAEKMCFLSTEDFILLCRVFPFFTLSIVLANA